MKILGLVLTVSIIGFSAVGVFADEHLFGFVRGAETLPQGKAEVYQFMTLRTGKAEGSYHGLDFETEVEYGISDRFQMSLSLEQRYIRNKDVNGPRDGLDDFNGYRFGGFALSGKYRLLSPFKDVVGLALRLEGGYLWHDEVGGLEENEYYINPEIDLQKNFRDDTIVCNLNLGAEWAWGKQPAEEYPREVSLKAGTGVSYRFARNWFIGVESTIRSEYPMFALNNFEHVVVYAGPSLHYSSKNWWATLSYAHQVWGDGVGEPHDGKTYAEETDHQVRLKVGFNF